MTLTDQLFGPETVPPLPYGLRDWLTDHGVTHDPDELMAFANHSCRGCNEVDTIGEVIVLTADPCGTCDDHVSTFVWCQACLWHKEACAKCGPLVPVDVFYLPFRKLDPSS